MMEELKLRLGNHLHEQIVMFLKFNAGGLSTQDQQLMVLECLTDMAESLAAFSGVIKTDAREQAGIDERH
jgi:hypothetical protein